MSGHTHAIRSRRLVAEGRVGPGVVHLRGGKIERVEWDSGSVVRPGSDGAAMSVPGAAIKEPGRIGAQSSALEEDVGDMAVMPGLVDTHVHVNEPGRAEWEGFDTAGRAAAAGGITTIVVMPLNCTPAATNVAALRGEIEAAAGVCRVDHGFWGGLVPGNASELEPMWRAGALGFKCFMIESGVEDFHGVTSADIGQGAAVLARLGAPLLVHAEDPDALARARETCGLALHPRSYDAYLRSRPSVAEMIAVRTAWMHAGPYPTWPVHIVHVTCSAATAFLDDVARGPRAMTGETCPHYLTFCAEEIPDGATQFKCAPPIRGRDEREALWAALSEGRLSMVVSDHSPCPPELKRMESGDFSRAWGGVSSLQLGLSATWTGAAARGFTLADVARWMSENPAKLAGIQHHKGRIAPGQDADLVILDPEATWTVRQEALQHRHKITPYHGMVLRGVVRRTILRGRTVYDASSTPNPFPAEPTGQWISRAPQ